VPTYQYACTTCGHQLEAVQSFSDAALTACPECDGRLRKVFSSVGIVFKGSGFYRTDSRSDAATNDGAKEPAAAGAAKSDGAASSSASGSSDAPSGSSSGAASNSGSTSTSGKASNSGSSSSTGAKAAAAVS
jgi:putative FmdB family regulatory protein